MSKKRCSARKTVDEDLDLQYPLEALKCGEASKNKEVILHLLHFMRSGVKGHTSLDDATRLTRESVKSQWKGSNVELGHDKTIDRRIKDLHQLFR